MKQTAVEWYVEKEIKLTLDYIENKINELEYGIKRIKLVEQAKEMEINQHKETWDVAHQAGRFEGKDIAEENWQTFEGYWEENFKSE